MWVWYTSDMNAWDGSKHYHIRLNSQEWERERPQAISASFMMIPGTYAQMAADYD